MGRQRTGPRTGGQLRLPNRSRIKEFLDRRAEIQRADTANRRLMSGRLRVTDTLRER
jgi:hypothetical protein